MLMGDQIQSQDKGKYFRWLLVWVTIGWDGVAPVGAKGASVAGALEREGEGPLPGPTLTAHAQSTCFEAHGVSDCFFEIWKSLRTDLMTSAESC